MMEFGYLFVMTFFFFLLVSVHYSASTLWKIQQQKWECNTLPIGANVFQIYLKLPSTQVSGGMTASSLPLVKVRAYFGPVIADFIKSPKPLFPVFAIMTTY